MGSHPVICIERLWPGSQHLAVTRILVSFQMCLLNGEERKGETEERRVALIFHHIRDFKWLSLLR